MSCFPPLNPFPTVVFSPMLFRLLCLLLFLSPSAFAQPFTQADTLRGSITPQRAWWDVVHYDLSVDVFPADSTITGTTTITYAVLDPAETMQLDLQHPMRLDSVVQDGRRLQVQSVGNAHFVEMAKAQEAGSMEHVTAYFSGKPRVAPRAPWDGGFVWGQDSLGRPWIATAVQGLGASAWWPLKDTQADEPDSQRVAVSVPASLTAVSNGRLRQQTDHSDAQGNARTAYVWAVTNPINNYNISLNIGHYAHIEDTFAGESGPLTLDYYPLDYNEARARRQFDISKPMLACFEHWFGPFPWYEDGYTLVETPHLGMEHQSAIAYGNEYQNGYRGRDLSGTGHGLLWDFIVIHEAGHEWFGNNISTDDIADMWVHESFTNYSENLFTECQQGRDAGAAYVIGTRANVQNDKPIVGPYGVNQRGSGDMYYKGGNMLHTIRHIIADDDQWRAILRGLNETFGKKTVTGLDVQRYVSSTAGIALDKVFEQYLTTTQIPVFEYRLAGPTLWYRWTNTIDQFDMPLDVQLTDAGPTRLYPTAAWQTVPATFVRVDQDFYVDTRRVD